MTIENSEIIARFMEKVKDGEITCAECFAVADEFGIKRDDIASTLTANNIKIIKCQLGCFS